MRTSTPSCASACFTSSIDTSRRWKIPAASAASITAPPAASRGEKTSEKWLGLPAPLLAITEIAPFGLMTVAPSDGGETVSLPDEITTSMYVRELDTAPSDNEMSLVG